MSSDLVKFVFKSLLGTIITIVLGMFTIEYINLAVTAYNVRDAIETSLLNACNSFNQESYRSTSLEDLMDSTGNKYMSGNVYGSTGSGVYDRFYGQIERIDLGDGQNAFRGEANKEYKSYLGDSILNRYDGKNSSNSSVDNTYEDLRYLSKAYSFVSGNLDTSDIMPGTSEYSEVMFGINMIESEYTPMNLNAVYLGISDRDKQGPAYKAVTNLFKWNLAQLWSNCSDSMRFTSETGEKYVQKSGWRVYTDTATIDEIQYNTFNVSNADSLKKLSEVTNISNAYYKNQSDNSGNEYVMAARLAYEVEVEYVGITPIGKIISYVNNIGDKDYGSADRDYKISGGETGIDITRENEGDTTSRATIKTKEDNRDYYVWYYNIT